MENIENNITNTRLVNLIQLLQDGPDLLADYLLFDGARNKMFVDVQATPPDPATIQADLKSLEGCISTLSTDAKAVNWTSLSNLLDEFNQPGANGAPSPMQELINDVNTGNWGDAALDLSGSGAIGEIGEEVGTLIWNE